MSGKHTKKTGGHLVKRRRRPGGPIAFLFLLLVLAAGASACLYISSLAYRVCYAEAGVPVNASDFIKDGDPLAAFTADSPAFDVTVPGEYRVKVKSGYFTHRATLIVQDTVAPKAQPVSLLLQPGESCAPEDLVSDIADVTRVTATFQQEPDYSRFGQQSIDVVVTDLGGNSVTVRSELIISPVAYEIDWEAGSSPPSAEDFLLSDLSARLITNIAALDLNTVADHKILLSVEGVEYSSLLHVVDTVPPKAQTQDLTRFAFLPLPAEAFLASTEDVTSLRAEYRPEPDWSLFGEQTVQIAVIDEGGNETLCSAVVTLLEDTEPPVITGVHDLELLEGETVAYRKGVVVTDNCEEGLTLDIDSSGVDLNTEGVYNAIYTATDAGGNSTQIVITVSVHAWSHSETELNTLADGVLDKILKPEMTDMEKVEAIYKYITGKIVYQDHSAKGDWSRAAYEGLVNRKGDCYVFASVSKLLLTRAGIENMGISKSTASGTHFWNLVDLGEGWYHFDTTPRPSHPRILMWTDEKLMAFSKSHGNSHDYDHDQYTGIN